MSYKEQLISLIEGSLSIKKLHRAVQKGKETTVGEKAQKVFKSRTMKDKAKKPKGWRISQSFKNKFKSNK